MYISIFDSYQVFQSRGSILKRFNMMIVKRIRSYGELLDSGRDLIVVFEPVRTLMGMSTGMNEGVGAEAIEFLAAQSLSESKGITGERVARTAIRPIRGRLLEVHTEARVSGPWMEVSDRAVDRTHERLRPIQQITIHRMSRACPITSSGRSPNP